MKIRVAVLDNDQIYLDRFVSAFSAKYSDKVELYSFSDLQIALDTVATNRIDIFVASENFAIDPSNIPSKCIFAYFVDNAGIDSFNNCNAICKFQKADLIYKQFLSLYSEKAGGISSLKLDDDSTKVIAFASPCGGVGTSTVAAACAKHFALNGNSVLYLCLEPFGSSDLFFHGDGQYDMSEVIYALKSKKMNLTLKLESCVRKDESGVCFFSATGLALDMLEMTNDDIVRLIEEVKLTGSYNYIVFDIDFALDKNHLRTYRLAHSVVWVSDGSEISNYKIKRAYQAVQLLEQTKSIDLADRLNLMYNRFSSKSGKYVEEADIKVVGGTQVFAQASVNQIVDQISRMGMFDNII
ncbi:MAG: chromosome partitioning protein ParA [Clostridiales bacterium]|nr:chromosome partitioning protein ParA [Clostridiales bacterium]